jgi:DNA-binding GntR family transcriptional regulator
VTTTTHHTPPPAAARPAGPGHAPAAATRPQQRADALDRSGYEPVYIQIADDLAARIGAGEFPRGKLPGERTLAAEYRVAYATVRRAMDLLRHRNMITTRHGRGTFTTPPAPSPPSSPTPLPT